MSKVNVNGTTVDFDAATNRMDDEILEGLGSGYALDVREELSTTVTNNWSVKWMSEKFVDEVLRQANKELKELMDTELSGEAWEDLEKGLSEAIRGSLTKGLVESLPSDAWEDADDQAFVDTYCEAHKAKHGGEFEVD